MDVIHENMTVLSEKLEKISIRIAPLKQNFFLES